MEIYAKVIDSKHIEILGSCSIEDEYGARTVVQPNLEKATELGYKSLTMKKGTGSPSETTVMRFSYEDDGKNIIKYRNYLEPNKEEDSDGETPAEPVDEVASEGTGTPNSAEEEVTSEE